MSYDIYMQVDTGGEYPATVCDVGNYTSNVCGMWQKALGMRLQDIRDKTGLECIPILENGVSNIMNPETRDEYIEMNPKNGWGDYAGACRYLQSVLDACREHPKAIVYVSA